MSEIIVISEGGNRLRVNGDCYDIDPGNLHTIMEFLAGSRLGIHLPGLLDAAVAMQSSRDGMVGLLQKAMSATASEASIVQHQFERHNPAIKWLITQMGKNPDEYRFDLQMGIN